MKIDMLSRMKKEQQQNNNTPPPDVAAKLGTRPRTINLNKKKVTLMKEDERNEMKKTTRDIRRMFQEKLDKHQ